MIKKGFKKGTMSTQNEHFLIFNEMDSSLCDSIFRSTSKKKLTGLI
jgi:hypothetical protein